MIQAEFSLKKSHIQFIENTYTANVPVIQVLPLKAWSEKR